MNNNIKLKRNGDGERFSTLALLGENLFHSDDIANIWGIHNKNTLHKTLSRYVKRGLMYRINKGFYSINKINEVDPYFLGVKSLHRPAYISCESVLYEKGILNQPPQRITIVSSVSKSFSIGNYNYKSRQIKDDYLLNNYGVETINGVRIASLERAIVDMLYFNGDKYFDSKNSKLIRWNKVKSIIKNIGYKINYNDITK